jgi:hypothetical protein
VIEYEQKYYENDSISLDKDEIENIMRHRHDDRLFEK